MIYQYLLVYDMIYQNIHVYILVYTINSFRELL